MRTITLKGGSEMPVIGLGTSQLKGEDGARAISEAIEVGYRAIDTAEDYGNHDAVAAAMNESAVPREEFFLTTKIPRVGLSRESVLERTKRYLHELQTEYVDLLLIHWPNRAIPIAETLGAMEELRAAGAIRAIGVSNFTERHLEEALSTGVSVSVNQVEVHPSFNQKKLVSYCGEKNIVVTAYAPLGRGKDLQEPLIAELAKKYGVSVPQVILNWIVSRGLTTIPKSSSRAHMEDNLKALTWAMDPSDIAAIDALPQGERIFNPPTAEFD